MPRLARACLKGGLHHVLNRGNHRQTLFHGPEEFAQFIELMAEGQRRHGVNLWGYCLMSNHWHVIVEVSRVEKLSQWVHWICNRHVRLFHRGRRDLGGGHIYQGRYKAFPIEDESYLQQVLRYVEANPVRAGLVQRGRDWPWSSLSQEEIKCGLVTMVRLAWKCGGAMKVGREQSICLKCQRRWKSFARASCVGHLMAAPTGFDT